VKTGDRLPPASQARIYLLTAILGLAPQALCCRPLRGLSFLTFIGGDAFGEGVAMDAEDGGRVREMLLVAREGLLDVELLEFADGLIQEDVAFEHFVHQGFEAIVNQSSLPVSNLYASR